MVPDLLWRARLLVDELHLLLGVVGLALLAASPLIALWEHTNESEWATTIDQPDHGSIGMQHYVAKGGLQTLVDHCIAMIRLIIAMQ